MTAEVKFVVSGSARKQIVIRRQITFPGPELPLVVVGADGNEYGKTGPESGPTYVLRALLDQWQAESAAALDEE